MKPKQIQTDVAAKQILLQAPTLKLSGFELLLLKAKYLSWRVQRKFLFKKRSFDSSAPTIYPDLEDIEIVIPVFGESELIGQCLQAIENSKGIVPKVVVVDNGTSQESRKLIESFSCVKNYIANETNEGFGGGCNIGIESCTGDFVILMNSDIVVKQDAIRELIQTTKENNSIGLCSSVLTNQFGRVEEAGRVLNQQGHAIALFENNLTKKLPNRKLQVVPYASFACISIRRDAYIKSGGFDPIFFPAYSEDVDLSIEFRKQNLVSAVAYKSLAFHQQGLSASQLPNLDKIKDKNRHALVSKHREYFEQLESIDEPFIYPDQLRRARVANMGSSQLVISSRGSIAEIEAITEISVGQMLLHNIAIIGVQNNGVIKRFDPSAVQELEQVGVDVFVGDMSDLKDWFRERVMVFKKVLISDSLEETNMIAKLAAESQPNAEFKKSNDTI